MGKTDDRHLFFSAEGNLFIARLLASLEQSNPGFVNRCAVVEFSPRGRRFGSRKATWPAGVEVIPYEMLSHQHVASSRSATLLSLSTLNSHIAVRLIDEMGMCAENIYIIVADDEVERWTAAHDPVSGLTIDESRLIDANVLRAIEVIENYICPRHPFGTAIENAVGHSINIIDTTFPLGICDRECQNQLASCLKVARDKGDKSYLLGSKPAGRTHNTRLLWSLLWQGLTSRQIAPGHRTIGLWHGTGHVKSLLPEVLMVVVRRVLARRRVFLTFRPEVVASPANYFARLMNYDVLIAQGRGGGTAIKEVLRYGGEVIVPFNSWNARWLEGSVGLRCNTVTDAEDIAKSILRPLESSIGAEVSADLIQAYDDKGVDTLMRIYA